MVELCRLSMIDTGGIGSNGFQKKTEGEKLCTSS